MSTTLVSLEEYLNTDYSPDREYVAGQLLERNVGERPHSRVQSNFNHFLQNRNPNIYVWPEVRVRTSPTRIRIPDICVTLDDPGTDIFETPPFLCIEVLSPGDDISRTIEKLEEYAAMGVAHLWLVDTRLRKAFTYSNRCLQEVTTGELRAGKDIFIPLGEVFDRL
jgi:Uma2 family endonuclease